MSWGSPAVAPTGDKAPKTVYYLGVLRTLPGQQAVELVRDEDLSSFSMFTRKNYQQFINFTTKTVAERTKVGERGTVEEQIGKIFAYHTSMGFCAIMATEASMKPMDAQTVLSKVVDEFKSQFTPTEIKEKDPSSFSWPQIKILREQATKAELTGISAVQKELDETKFVLHKTIESVLERGEKLDALVAKSDELSGQSKMFYKTAKQQNACCVVM